MVAEPYRSLPFAQEACRKLVEDYAFSTILDVGSGAGAHARLFQMMGKRVTAVDFGKSIYFEKRGLDYQYLHGDFASIHFREDFDCVWASHVLEHQPDPGKFLRRCIGLLVEGGVLAITVPPLKNEIVGGHLSLWNAGLLLYQLVFNGLDCREAAVKSYGYNVSVIVRKQLRPAVELAYDSGDIDLLSPFFPGEVHEAFDGRIWERNW
jgi:SAM-dependent methyltransferase